MSVPYDPSVSIFHPDPEHLQPFKVWRGHGAPDPSLGNDNDLYIDLDSNVAYIKEGTWITISGSTTVSGGGGTAFSTVDPEGVVTAVPGTIVWQGTTQAFWVKNSGTGNTGWVAI